jgi:hypothetical protein
MDRGRVGEDRGSKETDGCPLTTMGKTSIVQNNGKRTMGKVPIVLDNGP